VRAVGRIASTVIALTACATSGGDAPSRIIDLPIAVLLGDGRILIAQPDESMPWGQWRPDSATIHQHGAHLLGQSTDARHLVALLPRADLTSSMLLVLDLEAKTTRSRVLLDSGAAFTALTMGPQTGQAYVVGSGTDGVVASSFSVPTLEPGARRSGGVPRATPKPVHSAVLDTAERRLYVSFHEWTDWFTLEGKSLTPCPLEAGVASHPDAPPSSSSSSDGCIASHGIARVVSTGVIYATGFPVLQVLTTAGQIDSIAIDLEGNHLMDFDVDSANDRVVAVGSCGFTGGFATASLSATRERLVRPTPSGLPMQPVLCGERISVEPQGRWAVVAKRASPPFESRGPGEVIFIDTETGELLRRFSVSAPPIDVLVLRRYGTRIGR
jgi:hypothetical protein